MNLPKRVLVEVDACGDPETVRSVASGDDARNAKQAIVAEVFETWRVNDEWWRIPIRRQYAEVLLEGGKHVMLFEDLETGEWFMQRV
ncbi:MAG TPA: hypothetical protein VGA37_03275 [Gemmatimonadales bacterium]